MKPLYIILTVLVISISSNALADERKEDLPTLKLFEVKDVTMREAVDELNKAIWRKYPGKKAYLISYIEPPFPSISSETGKVVPRIKNKFSFRLRNNPPLIEIVRIMAARSTFHFRRHNSQIILYGWHLGDINDE